MGWASGSQLAIDVWNSVRPHISKNKREQVASDIVDLFEGMDCDTIDEAEQLCEDAGRTKWWEDEEDEDGDR